MLETILDRVKVKRTYSVSKTGLGSIINKQLHDFNISVLFHRPHEGCPTGIILSGKTEIMKENINIKFQKKFKEKELLNVKVKSLGKISISY